MSQGDRAGKNTGRVSTRLLLPLPGAEPEPQVETPWRASCTTPSGEVAPDAAAATIRVSRVSGKHDKALITALANDDTDALRAISESSSSHASLAGMLLGLRLAGTDPVLAEGFLSASRSEGHNPWDHKFLRRHLPSLQIFVQVTPGVPVVVAADHEAVVLLHAELLTKLGRPLEVIATLEEQPITPIVGLALASIYLATGQNEKVVALTDGLANNDDLTALCLVARGVALRAAGRNEEAIAAFDAAIKAQARHRGMLAAALGERAALLQASGDELAAQADLDRIVELEGGSAPSAVTPAEAAEAGPGLAMMELSAPTDDELMTAARTRVRRHIAMTGAPGTFGGRHHRTYLPEIEAMLAAGQIDAAESLLLGLIDAVEDEAEVDGIKIDPTFYLTLADLFAHRGDRAEYLAVMERFDAATARFGLVADAEDLAEVTYAMDQHEASVDQDAGIDGAAEVEEVAPVAADTDGEADQMDLAAQQAG